MNEPRISAEDQERIDGMVAAYRRSVENLYRMAFLAGSIAQVEADRDALKSEVAA